jgi:Putative zinc-finger
MRTESCRAWRESLGAYTLGHLGEEERAGIEAHLEGCPDCRREADSLALVSRLLPLGDPERFGSAPVPPPALGKRVAARIDAERATIRRRTRRRRFGLAMGGAFAAIATATTAIVLVAGSSSAGPEQHVVFSSLPPGIRIAATLQPRAFGTQIEMYVSGMRSGTLCRVFLRSPNGARVSAGTFRYRYGGNSEAVLSSALDLSRTEGVGVQAGTHTFIEPLGRA